MSDLKLSDIQEIFKKNHIACDSTVLCNVDDWNNIGGYILQLEQDKIALIEKSEALQADKAELVSVACSAIRYALSEGFSDGVKDASNLIQALSDIQKHKDSK